jgi:dynein heavy chain
MYTLLENSLPGGITDKDEMDARSYLRSNWNNLVEMSEKIGKNLSVKQT